MPLNVIEPSFTRLQIAPNASRLQKARKIGVVLGAGIPEGLVGLGMLIALHQLRIPIRIVAGTSLGAFIGALYTSGIEPQRIKALLVEHFEEAGIRQSIEDAWLGQQANPRDIAERFANLFTDIAGWDPEFQELKIPFLVTAAEKTSQKPIVIRHGSVKNAIKATLTNPDQASSGEGALKGNLLYI